MRGFKVFSVSVFIPDLLLGSRTLEQKAFFSEAGIFFCFRTASLFLRSLSFVFFVPLNAQSEIALFFYFILFIYDFIYLSHVLLTNFIFRVDDAVGYIGNFIPNPKSNVDGQKHSRKS